MGSWLELAGRALVFVVVGVMGGVTFRRFWQKEKARARLPRRTRTPAGWAAPVAHLCHFVCGTCHHLYARVRRSMRVPPEHARRPPLRASHTLPARGRDHSSWRRILRMALTAACAWRPGPEVWQERLTQRHRWATPPGPRAAGPWDPLKLPSSQLMSWLTWLLTTLGLLVRQPTAAFHHAGPLVHHCVTARLNTTTTHIYIYKMAGIGRTSSLYRSGAVVRSLRRAAF